jgi:diguanylate cyclase (GGDEF)-like protein
VRHRPFCEDPKEWNAADTSAGSSVVAACHAIAVRPCNTTKTNRTGRDRPVTGGSEQRALRYLEALLEVTNVLRGEREEDAVLSTIVRAVAEASEFRTVALNLYRPAFDDFYVSTVHGSREARQALLGSTYDWDDWQMLFAERFSHGGACLIPHGTFDWSLDSGNRYVPPTDVPLDPGAWHPEDELFVPVEDSAGRMLGIFSVGEPSSGCRPGSGQIEVFVALAAHAAIAIEAAQQAARRARDRAGLEQLLEVSSRLTAAESTETMLGTVCRGIQTALGFERVVLDLLDTRTRLLHMHATAGMRPVGAAASRPLAFDAVQRLFEPQFDVAGCFLVPRDEALLRVDPNQIEYTSQNNGRGPYAWNHHWLAVPLYDRGGDVIGVIWVDEPEDRLLPSRHRLQALRVFANQATTALLQAREFDQLRFLADHDPLTGMLNRRSFVRALESEVARARRYASPLALLVFDFDDLKALNDTHGHAAGDEALQQVAETLHGVVRGGDHAFRIGGDEFAVILPEATADDAQLVAARIADELRAAASDLWKPSMSFGIAALRDENDPSGLFRSADRAMYAMKRRRAAMYAIAGTSEGDEDLNAVA